MDRDRDSGEPSSKSKKIRSSSQYDNSSCQIMVDDSQNVLNVIRNLYVDKQMCDICLLVNNREHHAHRIILSAFSDVFRVMLMTPEWSEWHESRIELEESIPGCEKVFHLFLEYFYTGKILITHTNVMPILALADKYLVKGLSRLCIDYMCSHIPHAASHNQLFVWLQYSLPNDHKEVAEKCQNYLRWNLESIANTPDFSNLEPEMLITILQKSDLIIYNEMVLYNCVVRWLDLQLIKLKQSEDQVDQIQSKMRHLVMSVMRHIRFPMLTPKEIADLLTSPLMNQYRDFFLERMRFSMSFHTGRPEVISNASEAEIKLLKTPRLYTSDVYSAMLIIDNYGSVPSFHTSTFVFSSPKSPADCESDKINGWVVDLYPKGVWFKKCLLIVWQGTFEVPEQVRSTVRLSLTCRELCAQNIRARVAILIYGIQGGVEHVMQVKEVVHQFNSEDKVLNMDDLIPFEELNPKTWNCSNQNSKSSDKAGADAGSVENKYLVGPNRDQLKLSIVIAPLDGV